MSDEELTKVIDSIQEKAGSETSALIADDLGLLISGNAAAQKFLKDKDSEIARLTAHNEKLILANGNLLKQIPVEHSEPKAFEDEKPAQTINLADAFDAHGRFKH